MYMHPPDDCLLATSGLQNKSVMFACTNNNKSSTAAFNGLCMPVLFTDLVEQAYISQNIKGNIMLGR